MPEIWFTSDTHFGHERGMIACNRPFRTAEEMDEELISKWNALVSPKDRVFHLGDFSFRRAEATRNIIRRLRGEITLVIGNHDRRMAANTKALFHAVTPMQRVKLPNGISAWCSHFPFEVWDGCEKGAVHFHGHCHGSLRRKLYGRMDVGVDVWEWAPVHWEAAMLAANTGDRSPQDYH